MAFAKFQVNRFRIDGEIAENHAILVNLTASIVQNIFAIAGYVDHVTAWPMSIYIHTRDDSDEPANS